MSPTDPLESDDGWADLARELGLEGGAEPVSPAADPEPDFDDDAPAELDDAIQEMLDYDGPFILDVLVEKHANCFPMIPSGEPHNKMLLGEAETQGVIGSSGATLV